MIVDLTMPIYSGMPVYPGHPATVLRPVKNIPEDGRNVSELSMSCHAGTHLDAPLHFIAGGKGVGEIDPNLFVGECAINPDLAAVRARTMLKTGWYKNFGKPNYYTDSPSITPTLAYYFINQGVRLLLLDYPSPDRHGYDHVHKIFLEAGVILVEYLTNTDALGDAKECEIFVGALRIPGCDGAPCRVLARPL